MLSHSDGRTDKGAGAAGQQVEGRQPQPGKIQPWAKSMVKAMYGWAIGRLPQGDQTNTDAL